MTDASTPALCIVGRCDETLWGRTPADRLERQFAQAGVSRVMSSDEAGAYDGPVVLVRADAVLDQPLVAILVREPGLALVGQGPEGAAPLAAHVDAGALDAAARLLAQGGDAPAGLDLRVPADLDAAFWKGLRKRETPYALIVASGNRGAVEWRMFMGTYKGATDFITKHVWPRPAFHATKALAGLGGHVVLVRHQ